MEWLDKNHPNVQFLLNSDDDVFVNTDDKTECVTKALMTIMEAGTSIQAIHLITHHHPSSSSAAYTVQKSRTFPHVGGAGYLWSNYAAAVIREMSHSVILHPNDDVHVGMFVHEAGLRPTFVCCF